MTHHLAIQPGDHLLGRHGSHAGMPFHKAGIVAKTIVGAG
jgi:hypothetical protein